MLSLLWAGILINVFRILIPHISTWVTKTFCVTNIEEINKLRQELKDCRKDLAEISIVDEFANHARLSRKISALQNQLDKEIKLSNELCNNIKSKLTLAFQSLLLVICVVIFFKSSEPVVSLPRKWMLPLSFFGESSWSVGFNLWLAMSSACVQRIHSVVAGSS